MLFTVLDSGYIPRSTEETDNVTESRIEKIYRLISESRFAIHDISRTQLDRYKLPRFNMPLELGIFLGSQRFGKNEHSTKECLVLDKERYRYQKFISDIAGQDIHAHKNTEKRIIQIIRNWLRARTTESIPSHTTMIKHYRRFKRALPIFCETLPIPLDSKTLTYNDYIFVAGEWLRINT